MAEFSLLVYDPVFLGNAFRIELGAVESWRRSIRANGGYWQGSFALSGSRFDPVALFNEWLGFHIIERSSAGNTWEGLIYELELSYNGITRRRSLDLMSNAVDVSYQSAGAVSLTGFSVQSESIERYGRREARLSVSAPLATATAFRSRSLAASALPWARPVSIGAASEPILSVRVCGYVFTANWLFATAGDGTEHDLDHWISALVGTAEGLSSDHGGSVSGAGDCQFLSVGAVASNTLQVRETIESDTRAWALLEALAGLGDSSGDPWLVWVGPNRLVHYQAADFTVQYTIQSGGVYVGLDTRASVDPFMLWPGLARDLSYPLSLAETGSMFADWRDFWIDEIEVSADGGITFKTSVFDEAAVLSAQAQRLEAEGGS